MINKLTRFASSFAALLGDSTQLDVDGRIEDVRAAMLQSISPHIAPEAGVPRLWSNIARASDIQTLWYLRNDLLALLAENVGEPKARESLTQITEMFRGVVPEAQMPRARKISK